MAELYAVFNQSEMRCLPLLTVDSSFHEKTKASKPSQPSKPTTYWIAVLPLDKKPEGPKTEEDYLWIKCQKVSFDVRES